MILVLTRPKLRRVVNAAVHSSSPLHPPAARDERVDELNARVAFLETRVRAFFLFLIDHLLRGICALSSASVGGPVPAHIYFLKVTYLGGECILSPPG